MTAIAYLHGVYNSNQTETRSLGDSLYELNKRCKLNLTMSFRFPSYSDLTRNIYYYELLGSFEALLSLYKTYRYGLKYSSDFLKDLLYTVKTEKQALIILLMVDNDTIHVDTFEDVLYKMDNKLLLRAYSASRSKVGDYKSE